MEKYLRRMIVRHVIVTKVVNAGHYFLNLNVPSYFFSLRLALTSLVRRHAHQQPCGSVVPSPQVSVSHGSGSSRPNTPHTPLLRTKITQFTTFQLKMKSFVFSYLFTASKSSLACWELFRACALPLRYTSCNEGRDPCLRSICPTVTRSGLFARDV